MFGLGGLKDIKRKLAESKQRLEDMHITEERGGIRMTITASKRMIDITVDPEAAGSPDLAHRIKELYNIAAERADLAAKDEMQGITGGIPGLGNLFN